MLIINGEIEIDPVYSVLIDSSTSQDVCSPQSFSKDSNNVCIQVIIFIHKN